MLVSVQGGGWEDEGEGESERSWLARWMFAGDPEHRRLSEKTWSERNHGYVGSGKKKLFTTNHAQ